MNGFFVEIDDMNHTLKQRFDSKNKQEEPIESVRTIGYYPNLPSCIEKIARLNVIQENDEQFLSIREYAYKAELAFKNCRSIKLS